MVAALSAAKKSDGKLKMQSVLNTEEKGSDVNLAAQLVFDACQNKIDVAIVISNDTDLAEPIRIVAQELNKVVITLCPHKNIAYSLQKIKNVRHYTIETTHLARYQFPNVVGNATKPTYWN